MIVSTSDPTTSNKSPDQYIRRGDKWYNSSTGSLWECVDPANGTWVATRSPISVANATARDAAIPSPTAGQEVVNQELGLQTYMNGFWRTAGRSVLHDLDVDLWFDAGRGINVDAAGSIAKWTDQSGNAYPAEESTNQPTLSAAGSEFPYVTFDGTDDILTLTKANFANSLTALTVLVRCAFPASADGYVVGRYASSGDQRSWALKYDNADDRAEWLLSHNGSTAILRYGSEDTDDGVFRTLAMSYSFDANEFLLYENGALVATDGNGTLNSGSDLHDSTADLELGLLVADAANVHIQHLAIFNKVLTQSQVEMIHNEWANRTIGGYL